MATPEGWRVAALDSLIAERADRQGSSPELPVLSVSKDHGLLLQSEKFKKRIASSDTSRYLRIARGEFAYDPMLLWSGTVARQRRVDEGIISPAYYVFRVDSRAADGCFLEYLLRSPSMLSAYLRISEGTNVRRKKADFRDFASIQIPLPPLGEQRKIAAILSSIDDTIEKTEAVIAQLEVVKKAMMQELLTRGMPGRHTRFKQTEIGEIPEGWEVAPVGTLCERMFVGIAQAATHAYVAAGGVPIVRTTNVKANRIERDEMLRISRSFADEMASKSLRKGDVLSARTGYPGVSALVDSSLDGAQCFTLLVSRPGPQLRGQHLVHVMNSTLGERIVQQGQAGGAQQNLNVGVFENAKIPLPPISEQEEIDRRIDGLYARELAEKDTRAVLSQLKQHLASALLSGDLRVTPAEARP